MVSSSQHQTSHPGQLEAQIKKKDIEEIVPSKVSAMPAGLLNALTPEEIADLFEYMRSSPDKNIVKRPQATRKE